MWLCLDYLPYEGRRSLELAANTVEHQCRVIRLAPFANRLSMNVPPHIQLLRCLANFKALQFSSSIAVLADKIVGRMKEKSLRTGGKYVSIHLRFEEVLLPIALQFVHPMRRLFVSHL